MATTRRALFRILPPCWLAYLLQALKAADSTESYWQLEMPMGRLRQQFATTKVYDWLGNNPRIAIATTPASDWGRLRYCSAEIDLASEAFRQVARG